MGNICGTPSDGLPVSEYARLYARSTPAKELRELDVKIILWDMDGVLADVSKSYRTAIIKTAEHYDVTVTGADISAAKAAGNANNDWVLTLRLIEMKMGAGSPTLPTLDEVTAVFEGLYLGADGVEGLRMTEKLIVKAELLQRLADRFPMGVVTGRPREQAKDFLATHSIEPLFPHWSCMRETEKPKPDKGPVLDVLAKMGYTKPVFDGGAHTSVQYWLDGDVNKSVNADQIILIGDTVDDVRAAVAAGCIGIGVIAPGTKAEDLVAERDNLRDAGAYLVLEEGLEDLEALLIGREMMLDAK